MATPPIPGNDPGVLLLVAIAFLVMCVLTYIGERIERWAGPR